MQNSRTVSLDKNDNTYSIAILGILFFTFGFITWVHGSLIQFLKVLCELKGDLSAFFVTFAFYIAYFVLALPSAYIIKKTGYKNGMSLGLFVMALGSLVFIPASMNRSFGFFLTGLFMQGCGLAILQTAVNPYISIIGPIESAAKRISIMGICNKAAGIMAPLILSAILLKNATVLELKLKQAVGGAEHSLLLNELSERIQMPYFVISLFLLLLSFFIYKSKLPEINTDMMDAANPVSNTKNKTSIFQFRHLLLGVVCIFLYVGVEVMAGDAIGVYGKAMGLSIDETKYFTTFTLSAMLVGYLIGIFTMPKIISQQTALKISAILGIIITCAIFFTQGYTSIMLIALLGFANALMWPAIFPLAINGLGTYTKKGAALLIMGIAGGAIVPVIYAILKQGTNGLSNELSFLICMLPSSGIILIYTPLKHSKRYTDMMVAYISKRTIHY